MAEEKKGDKKPDKKDAKKPAEGGGTGFESEIIFWLLIGAMLIFIILPTILNFFNINLGFGDASAGGTVGIWQSFIEWVQVAFSKLFGFVTAISIFGIVIVSLAIFYAKFKLKLVMDEHNANKAKADHVHYVPSKPQSTHSVHSILPTGEEGDQGEPLVMPVNPKWKTIEEHMVSQNSSDWRLAILEADIMLYDMLDQMGYEGESIAEKLKQANPDRFHTLDDAWKAHKVRNVIAHEGASYVLGRTQADRTIALYKRVFDEFYYV